MTKYLSRYIHLYADPSVIEIGPGVFYFHFPRGWEKLLVIKNPTKNRIQTYVWLITPDVPISIQVQNVNTTSGYSSGDLSDSDDAIPVSDSDQQKRGQKRKSELKRKPEVKYNCWWFF